ncbi:MAG: hypothetical protein AAFX06_20010 [Planctomycetota bacterium]
MPASSAVDHLIGTQNLNLDPTRAYHFLHEREPAANIPGRKSIAEVSTLFLTVSRCPVGCAMCDLHLNTLSHPTPPGHLERQIRGALERLPPADWIKLYNSGNFFDPKSIPPDEYDAIAECCEGFERIIIENHPRFGRSRHESFRDLLPGRLEIAVGLETVQPRWLARLQKQMTRDDFDRYAKCLKSWDIDLRVFLIVGVPESTTAEAVRWARLSVRHAAYMGARHISLIPARAGHGWNGAANSLPEIGLAVLSDLFAESLADVATMACVSVDLWGFEQDDLPPEQSDHLRRLERAILAQDASHL